jgi:cyclin H
MTYDPQTISRSIIFIANKAEGAHLTLDRYASSLPKTTPDSILAPEYLIVQALRFNYEVRHPYRALKGGHLELAEMAKGNARLLPSETKTPAQVREEMLKLPRKVGGIEKTSNQQELDKRVLDAYSFASHILKTAALFTDAYFLYTPSHIWLAAQLIADEPLTLFYLSTKSPSTSPIHIKLLKTIRSCAEMLRTHRTLSSPNQTPQEKEALDKKEKEEISVLMKKLRQCRDPDKIDLVKLNQAQKRDALASGGDDVEESTAKRRKITKEQYEKEADDFWGPELSKNGGANGLKKE